MTADDIRLVLRLARGDRAAAVRLAEARTAPFDDLADRALAEGLGVVLFRGWSALPSGAPFVLSDSYLDALRARAERQAVRTAAQIDALAHITDTFAAAGLSFILLKGPYLAARFYGDPAGREFVDLDLLVRRADRARASERLTSIGYARRSRVLGSEALTAWFVHAFDYADARTYLDLLATFTVSEKYSFRVGVNNVFDKDPPLNGASTCPTGPCNGNTWPGVYDALGRYIYVGLTADF